MLGELAERVQIALGDNLVGVYLKGSFALGAGDVHADVDFLVVAQRELGLEEESNIREVHRRMPTRVDHWAHVLEGSYATLDQLRERANRDVPWLYVDNGQREMESSTHDNTETFRWVLKNRGLVITGRSADALLSDVPTRMLREEAAEFAARRHDDALADPEYLQNGWGQPHEVLTHCRMVEWHELVRAAIADRPNPWERIHKMADPRLTALTRIFIGEMKPRIVAASTGPLRDGE